MYINKISININIYILHRCFIFTNKRQRLLKYIYQEREILNGEKMNGENIEWRALKGEDIESEKTLKRRKH